MISELLNKPMSPRSAWLGCWMLALCACSRPPDKVEHYQTRGIVKAVDGSGEDARAAIHHERIESFKDRDGKASPMDSMTMNFAFAPNVSSRSLRPDDKLLVEFDVHWSSGAPLVITRFEKLAPSTELTLQ